MTQFKLHTGNNKHVLKTFKDNSVDSIITDPPYEYGFMSKAWDSTGIAYDVELWKECLRVVKPGGYIMAFGSSRTHHRLMVAIEDAGFEIRDTVCWIFGSGFPKSLNISKAINKMDGVKFNEIPASGVGFMNESNDGYNTTKNQLIQSGESSERAKQFEGWGTALKPAVEYICMARKPLSEKTVAENCLKWGTGGINIDESRVGYASEKDKKEGQSSRPNSTSKGMEFYAEGEDNDFNRSDRSAITGRFPANLIHDNSEEVRECFPDTHAPCNKTTHKGGNQFGVGNIDDKRDGGGFSGYTDSGNASRFFKSIIYQAKPSKAERNRGCEAVFNLFEQSEGLEEKGVINRNSFKSADWNIDPRSPNGGYEVKHDTKHQNNHPTVKPIALMEYLIKMVTPKGGIVLDPFNGSGSTGCAAVKNGFEYIGIDITPEYITISNKRIKSYI